MQSATDFFRPLDTCPEAGSHPIPIQRAALLTLSDVQFFVAVRKAQGYREQQIAEEIFVSKSTVTSHAWRARNALGCQSQREMLQLVLAEYAPELWLGHTEPAGRSLVTQ